MRNAQGGFTLIELVIVLTIMGILAATALPRYINMQSQARAAKAQALFGSVKSAAALARANCMVDISVNATPTCTATGGTTNMDGTNVTMRNQYPTADAAGIIAAAQLNATNDAVTVTPGTDPTTDPLLIAVNGAGGTCRISYTAAAAGPVAPVITLDTSGC